MKKKHTIWTDDWEEIEEIAKGIYEEVNAETVGDEEVELDYEEAMRVNEYYLEDERINLDIKTKGNIIIMLDYYFEDLPFS